MVQEIPIYDITLDGDSLGLTAISLVDSPAIMENWVAFSKHQMIWMSKAEKRAVQNPAQLFFHASKTISRVMSLDVHLSRPAVASRFKRPT